MIFISNIDLFFLSFFRLIISKFFSQSIFFKFSNQLLKDDSSKVSPLIMIIPLLNNAFLFSLYSSFNGITFNSFNEILPGIVFIIS